MTPTELEAIRRRAEREPGSWYADGCGAPVVVYGYEEALLNVLLGPGSPLYLRRRRGLSAAEERAHEREQLDQLFRLLRPVLAPAYEAQRDRRALLAVLAGRTESAQSGSGSEAQDDG